MMPYLAGLIDTDGSIIQAIRKRDQHDLGFSLAPQVVFDQYLAGLVDGDGAIFPAVRAPYLQQGRKKKSKFTIVPQTVVALYELDFEAIRLLNTILDDVESNLGININRYIRENKDGSGIWFRFGVYSRSGAKKFLGAIYPYLIIRRKQAKIILEEIIPRMENGVHLNKEGFLEIINFADQISALNGHGVRKKYTYDFFKELWGL